MTGTQNHEGIAGVLAAIDYLADLGRHIAGDVADRRRALAAAMGAIRSYEQQLCVRMIAGLTELGDVRVWGIVDSARFDQRVPTVSITHRKLSPIEVADHLARRGIFVWHGNFYALELTETLGLEPAGLVRLGLLHYNTSAEVDRLLAVLGELR
jgi:selenocysteine lyase/cysteine desulfurase